MFAPELGTQAFSGYRAFALSFETPSLEKIFSICTKVTSIQHKIDIKKLFSSMFAPELGTQAFSGYRAFALKANSQNGGAIVQYRKS